MSRLLNALVLLMISTQAVAGNSSGTNMIAVPEGTPFIAKLPDIKVPPLAPRVPAIKAQLPKLPRIKIGRPW